MKEITNIKQISSNKYSLIIEGKKHIVYDDVLLQYHIFKKGPINDDVYLNIIKENNYREAYNQMLKYITVKLRTENEIRQKLIKLSIKKDDQDRIIARLRKENYLNDVLYIKSYINDQITLTLKGPYKIFRELKNLSFADDLINKYLDLISEDLWKEKAEKILAKKIKVNHNLSKKMLILKLKKDFINLGYEAKYYDHLLEKIDIDDSEQMQKDYQKIYQKLSRKHSGSKLNLMIKQKMYQLGYYLDKISNLIED